MSKTFEANIELERLPLTTAAALALQHVDRYDLVVFTSKNAKRFFDDILRERRIAPPSAARIRIVGPRNDLLKLAARDKRILFPRSSVAPFDIVRKLRARGASVRALALYTTRGAVLQKIEKEKLLRGDYAALYFKSPSGVQGFLRQFTPPQRRMLQLIPARCIGPTTAKAAREAGFAKVVRADI